MSIKHNYIQGEGSRPREGSLAAQEIVINDSDGSLWSKNSEGEVMKVGGKDPSPFITYMNPVDMPLKAGSRSLLNLTAPSSVLIQGPSSPGDVIVIGDALNTWGSLNSLTIDFEERYEGEYNNLTLTAGGSQLTLEFINLTIGWKVVIDNAGNNSTGGGGGAGYLKPNEVDGNLLINPAFKVNSYSSVQPKVIGKYTIDGWILSTATSITQIVEAGVFIPNEVYTLTYLVNTDYTYITIRAPSEPGKHWRLPDIPVAVRENRLELGSVPTPMVPRPLYQERLLCLALYSNFYVFCPHTDALLIDVRHMRAKPSISVLHWHRASEGYVALYEPALLGDIYNQRCILDSTLGLHSGVEGTIL